MPDDTLNLFCPAKVNLALSVGSPDPQSGLHPLCSWMVATDFGDTMTLSKVDGESSSFTIREAKDAPASIAIDWLLEKDLAYRAHALMQQHVGRTLPIKMLLEKRIPAYAGLGGGSSDAAGMLVGLNRLFSLGLDQATLTDLAMQLGSDVGFQVMAQLGTNSAVVSGFGEMIEPAPLSQPIYLVLCTLPVKCSTAEVYHCYDKLQPSAEVDTQRVWNLVKQEKLAADAPFNVLAEPAFKVAPLLRELLDVYQRRLVMPVHVSGSGSSIFMVPQSLEEAERIRAFILSDIHAPAIVVRVQN